jgi:DNA-binding Lrp family transcriptional regulator
MQSYCVSSDLDDVDLSLINHLQSDATTSQQELGKKLNLSTAAINRRIKRLIDDGYLVSIKANIAAEKLGYPLTVITSVEIINEQTENLTAFEKSVKATPQVQQCFYVTGQWDFVIIFVVKNMNQYNELSTKLFSENENVKRFDTFVNMKTIVNSALVPIES